jgi:hypothetical protein
MEGRHQMSTNDKVEKIAGYEVHPAAKFLRLLDGDDFNNLVKDIEANGLREPIALLDGKLLDGRNRARACLKAGHKHEPVSLPPDTNPVAYVISKNIHRRHLRMAERLKLLKNIPAELIEQAKAAAKAAKAAGQKSGGRGKRKTRGSAEPRVSTAKAKGNIVGVSASTVKKFEKVERADPALAKEVEEGKTTVRAAHQKVKKSKAKATPVEPVEPQQSDEPKQEQEPVEGADSQIFGVWEQAHQYLISYVSYLGKLDGLGEGVADLVAGARATQKQFAKVRQASVNGAVET